METSMFSFLKYEITPGLELNLNKPHNQNYSTLRLYWLARRKATFPGVREKPEAVTAFNPRLSKNPIKQCGSSVASWLA